MSNTLLIDDGAQALSNKTIDIDNNTLSNLEVDNFKTGVIVTAISDDDTKIPSSGAVVDYAQPVDTDLTAIAGLSPSNDDIIQRKEGAWTNRTMAQLKSDLSLSASDVSLGNVTNEAQIAKSIGTTKGDLVVFTASATPARLAVGTNDQVLTADSSEAGGVKWADAGGGGNVDVGDLTNMTVRSDLNGSENTTQELTGLGFQPKLVKIYLDSTGSGGGTHYRCGGYLESDGTTSFRIGYTDSTSLVFSYASPGSFKVREDTQTHGTLTIDSLDADGFTIKVAWVHNGGGRTVTFQNIKYIAIG